MKNLTILLAGFLCLNLNAQEWDIISQNNKNSKGYTPDNVWMSPSGNRLMLSTNTQASLGLLGKRYVATNSQLQIYYECDTGFAERRIIEIDRNNVINNDRLGMQFMNDSLLHFQVIATGGNQILDYSVSNFEIIRGVMDVKNAKILNMVIEEDDPTTFLSIIMEPIITVDLGALKHLMGMF
jgi:hypothetical protein